MHRNTAHTLALVTLGLALGICSVILGAAASNRQTDVMPTSAGELRLMPIYHGSGMLEFAGKVIHIDPWSRGDYTGLPPADLIVVTHTHRDHLDMAMIEQLKKPGTIIVGTLATIQAANCAPACGYVETVTDSEKKTVMGIEIEGVPDVQPRAGLSPGNAVSPQGGWQRLCPALRRYECVLHWRYGVRAGNQGLEGHRRRVRSHESSSHHVDDRSRLMCESLSAEDRLCVSLQGLQPRGLRGSPEGHTWSRGEAPQTGRRAVRRLDGPARRPDTALLG